jgi:hypothetical protein
MAMKQGVIFLSVGILFVVVIIFSNGCAKSANPQPPINDTITVIKNDTTVKTDTLYSKMPDSTVNLTKGLLLYLPFSGNIADSSGNGNPTTAIGSVLTYDAHGYSNNAFGATGNGEEILVTNNGSIQFDTAYSLSYDFMVNAANQNAMYIVMVDPVTGEGPSFTTGTPLPGVPYLLFGTEDVTLGCSADGRNDNVNVVDTSGLIPVPGSWYNAIAIYHRGSAQLYVNGQLLATKTGLGTEANFCTSSQIIIGNWWNGAQPVNSESMNGKLDNIRLYDRVLTAHEIATLAQNYQVTSTQSQHPALKTQKPAHL